MYALYAHGSGSHDESNRYVLGGSISSVERWGRFSSAWDRLLRKWKLPKFRMSDAEALRGSFVGWAIQDRNECVEAFANLVNRHRIMSIAMTFDYARWRRMTRGVNEVKNDYKVANVSTIALPMYYGYVQVVCDVWGIPVNSVNTYISKHRGAMNILRTEIPLYWRIKGFEDPTYLDSSECKPLQGADMISWLQLQRSKDSHWEPESRHLPLVEGFMNETVVGSRSSKKFYASMSEAFYELKQKYSKNKS
ncbi:MAG: DUF3800 domain-containing protein [Planctomycetes bacterium]|nr:DUF3800 domain-containing protein [Planctomycetota bacterium]